MEKKDLKNKSNKKLMKIWAIVFGLIIVFGLLGVMFADILPLMITEQYFKIKEIREDNYNKKDSFYGESPDDLYLKLLGALRAKDIDLFVKYTDKNYQDEVRGILNKIKENDKAWEQMLDDVGNTEMNVIDYTGGPYAYLQIVDETNTFVEDFVFIKKTGEGYSFWKLYEM